VPVNSGHRAKVGGGTLSFTRGPQIDQESALCKWQSGNPRELTGRGVPTNWEVTGQWAGEKRGSRCGDKRRVGRKECRRRG